MDDDIKIVLGIIVAIAIVSGIFMVALVFIDFGLDTGAGEQTGYIAEVEQSGWLWRPAEIRLISIEPTYSETDTGWYYGSSSPEITELAKKYMKNHEQVIVSYELRSVATRWEYVNRVIITGITPVKASPELSSFQFSSQYSLPEGCYQNETGQDPNDLVMHFTCPEGTRW